MADLKRIARQMAEEVYSKGDLDVVDQLCAQNYKGQDWALGKLDRAGLKQQVKRMHAAFPDLKVEIDELVIEGNKVVGRYHSTGTQRGEYMGSPPSNKKFRSDGIAYYLFDKNSKIVEARLYYDLLSIGQQLGLIPELVSSAATGTATRPRAR